MLYGFLGWQTIQYKKTEYMLWGKATFLIQWNGPQRQNCLKLIRKNKNSFRQSFTSEINTEMQAIFTDQQDAERG